MVTCECHDKVFDNQASLDNHLAIEAGELTDRAVLAILDAVRQGIGPITAARRAGILPEVWKHHLRTNTRLQDALALAEEELAEEVEAAVLDAAKGRDHQSAKLWLERRSPNRWSPTPDKVEISIVESVKALPLEERLEKLHALLEARVELPTGDLDIVDAVIVDDIDGFG